MKNIPEVKSAYGNQAKMSKLLTYRIIDRAFLANFNWTGKSAGDKTKRPFKNLQNIIDLLHATVMDLDTNYGREVFLNHLKHKILKYACE